MLSGREASFVFSKRQKALLPAQAGFVTEQAHCVESKQCGYARMIAFGIQLTNETPPGKAASLSLRRESDNS
jgi:hypothetical protein